MGCLHETSRFSPGLREPLGCPRVVGCSRTKTLTYPLALGLTLTLTLGRLFSGCRFGRTVDVPRPELPVQAGDTLCKHLGALVGSSRVHLRTRACWLGLAHIGVRANPNPNPREAVFGLSVWPDGRCAQARAARAGGRHPVQAPWRAGRVVTRSPSNARVLAWAGPYWR